MISAIENERIKLGGERAMVLAQAKLRTRSRFLLSGCVKW